MQIKVYYLSLLKDTPHRGYWDYGLLDDLLKEFEAHEVDTLPKEDFGIVVIPARSHFKQIKKINQELSKLKSCLLFLMGDEETSFPIDKIKHKNILIWVQNPKPDINDKYRKLGCGYPQAINNVENLPDKSLDWFFAGQMTHSRRYSCVNELRKMDRGYMLTSSGFTQGLPQDEYYEKMATAKVVPCPGGPVTVDTFRLFEALELGCIPIADNESASKDWSGFWEWLFDEPVPFPAINDYSDLNGYIHDCTENYPGLNNKIQSWWMRYKSKLKNKIYNDIQELSGKFIKNPITVVIPVSPIPSHPETHILEETINSIRHHLPDSEIIITFDGVREEQQEMAVDYMEHIRRILWKSRFWGNVTPFVLEEHLHQSGMMQKVIDSIKTPLILYVEQDTPLVIDEPIDWTLIKESILNGESNVVRFHHEGVIPKEHNHLMIGKPENGLQKTAQWSQRPHLASKAFYRRIMSENFSSKSNCFIEDLIHGKLHEAYILDKKHGWDQWKVNIYIPDDKNIKRSYHTDGRAGAKKYDESQVW